MTLMTTSDRRRHARQMLPGCAGQVVTARYRGTLLGDRLGVPAGVLDSVAGRPGGRASRIYRGSVAAPGTGPRCPAGGGGGQKQPPCAVT
jgi:hypothetical protein